MVAKVGKKVNCSVCGGEYTAYRQQRPGYCKNACQLLDTRRKRLKLEIYTEFHGLKFQQSFDPGTGLTEVCTMVNFTPRGWELLGKYCAKSGQTAEEWVSEELKDAYREILGSHGLVVGDTRIVCKTTEVQ